MIRIILRTSMLNIFPKMNLTSLPLIAICGSTGSGKSEFAVQLSKLIKGEIINADAIQLYRGLDIATNKIEDFNMCGIPHHLIGILHPETTFNIHSYTQLCLPLINTVINAQKIPMITGGTHYYLEAILWKDFLASESLPSQKMEDSSIKIDLPTDSVDCYKKLTELNPARASRLHPNDVRKVKNAVLEEIRLKQSIHSGCCNTIREINRPMLPRFPGKSIIFWLDCKQSLLNQRLDKRVDRMIDSGLIQELDSFLDANFDNLLNESHSEPLDQHGKRVEKLNILFNEQDNHKEDPIACRGLLQSIGFKEFSKYLSLPDNERNSANGQVLLQNAIDRVKLSTRQYARRQISWIRNRFLRRPLEGSIHVYRLDTSSLTMSGGDTWEPLVIDALKIICKEFPDFNQYLTNAGLQLNTSITDEVLEPEAIKLPRTNSTIHEDGGPPFVCKVCSNRTFVQLDSWESHLQSRAHKKRFAKQKKRDLSRLLINEL